MGAMGDPFLDKIMHQIPSPGQGSPVRSKYIKKTVKELIGKSISNY